MSISFHSCRAAWMAGLFFTTLATHCQAAGKIAFTSARNGQQEIYSMNSDGSGQTPITQTNGVLENYSVWNPTGDKLAYCANDVLHIINADGTGARQVLDTAYRIDPDWSPDGTKLLFTGQGDRDRDIFTVNTDGTGLTKIITNYYGDYFGTWSQATNKIAFMTFPESYPDSSGIFVANPDGSGQVRLTNAGKSRDPHWSPDGTKIAFDSYRDGGEKEIYIMNADGSGQTRLTNNSALDIEPCFSPDGTQIAFVSNRDGNNEIYVMNVDGSGQTRLTFNPGTDENPDWVNPLPSRAPSLSVSAPTVTEVDSETMATATFTLSLSTAYSQPVTLTYRTLDGTATAPADYIGLPSTSLTFAPGETTKTVTVPVVGDDINEADENFRLVIAGLTNASTASPFINATILDNNDAIPTVSIGDASVKEGNSGTTLVSFPLTLSGPSGFPVSVTATTSSGTGPAGATSGNDFSAKAATIDFPIGTTTGTLSVAVNGDTNVETDETLTITLSSPSRAGLGRFQSTGTIVNDDIVRLSISGAIGIEGDNSTTAGKAVFSATLSQKIDKDVTFRFETVDGSAIAGEDYVASSGTVLIPAGELTAKFTVPFIGDSLYEPTENFHVNVTNLTNAIPQPVTNPPHFFEANGHYYQWGGTGIPWAMAKNIAAGRKLAGVAGHLVTVTSAEELAFLNTTFPNSTFWTGGTQPSGSTEPVGSWSWITGEEFTYAPWNSGEPNNAHNGEDALVITTPFGFNDAASSVDFGYVIEYDLVEGQSPIPIETSGNIMNDDPQPTLSIDDASALEGTGTDTYVPVNVTLSAPSASAVSVTYYTANGTATAPSDYGPQNNRLIFQAGETAKTVNIFIRGDRFAEDNETLTLHLSQPAGAGIKDGSGTLTILNDEYRPIVVSADPAAGRSATETGRTISTICSDANGASDISVVRLLINNTLNPANALYGYYDRPQNKLYLFNDAGTSITGGFAPGTANVITNSQGSLNCAQTSVVVDGNSLKVNWSFTPAGSFTGIKNLYGWVRDSSNQVDGFKDIGNWSIGVSNTGPANTSVTPASSSTGNGIGHALATVHTDIDGAADITQARLLINSALSGANGIHAIYDRLQNKLYLFNDAGTALQGGFAPGSSNFISNSQGTLDCAATTVTENGNALTIAWALTPAGSFTGVKNLYMVSRDATGAVAGWDAKGTWAIAGIAPVVGSATPASGSSSPGSARSITLTASDANGAAEISQVRLLINSSLNNANALYAMYDRVQNRLYLFNDAGTSVTGGFAPGSTNIITNSQGSLNCAETTVTTEGNTLTVNWNFTPASGFLGSKNLYALTRDTTGLSDGFDAVGSWTIAGIHAPVTTNVSPGSGTSQTGIERILTAVYTDADGAADIRQARILVNGGLAAGNALYAMYDKATGKLYLFNDAGTTPLGGFSPGSANVISNSQGSLNCAATTVQVQGENLTINWAFTPSAAFSGQKNLYLAVRDDSGTSAGWDNRGAWMVAAGDGRSAPQMLTSPSGDRS